MKARAQILKQQLEEEISAAKDSIDAKTERRKEKIAAHGGTQATTEKLEATHAETLLLLKKEFDIYRKYQIEMLYVKSKRVRALNSLKEVLSGIPKLTTTAQNDDQALLIEVQNVDVIDSCRRQVLDSTNFALKPDAVSQCSVERGLLTTSAWIVSLLEEICHPRVLNMLNNAGVGTRNWVGVVGVC